MAWGKAGSETLATSTVNGITITPSSASMFNQYMIHSMVDSNTKPPTLKLSGTSTSIAYRKSDNGVTDPTPSTGEPDVRLGDGTSDMQGFNVGYVCNISGEEKLGINFYVNAVGIGAGSAPARSERVFKDATTAQFTSLRFRMHTGATNTIADSNFTVLGSDEVLYVVQDGAIFYETDTNKSYVLYNGSWTEL